MESKLTSFLKALSWRFWGTISTVMIVFLFTKNYTQTFSIGAIDMIVSVILFYIHERAWLYYGNKRKEKNKDRD